MKLQDLSHGNQLELASKAVESFFDTTADIARLSESKARAALSAVRRHLAEVRKSHKIHTSEQNPKYLKAVMLEQALRARLGEAAPVAPVAPGAPSTGAPAATAKSLAVVPPPKPHEIQQRIQKTKDPKMKELLRKAAGGQQISTDDQKKLAALAADQTVTEDTQARKAELGKLMAKLARVIQSVKTVDQHRAAEKYANLVFNKIRDKVKADRGFAGISEVHDYLRAINQDLKAKFREITSGHQMNENKEYSIKYVQEDDVWAVVDSVGNRVESFIDKHEAVQAARKLNSGGAKAPNRHRHVNYRGDLEEGKLDDLKDKKAEKDDWFAAKTKREPAKKKVAGKQYGGSKQKDEPVAEANETPLAKVDRTKEPNAKSERARAKKSQRAQAEYDADQKYRAELAKTYGRGPLSNTNESATLRKVATAKLVEFYRKHRASGSSRVKMVESELFRRKRIMESKRTGRKLVTESEVQQAQVVLAAQDMVDQIQKMIEQASSAQFKDLPALVSQIRLDQGPDQSSQFNQAVTAAFSALLQALAGAKEQMEGAVDVVTGKATPGPTINPGDDAAPATGAEPAVDPAADAEADLDLDGETADITGFGRERR